MHKMQVRLREFSRPEKVAIYKNFFKTGKGEYGEGDVFIGVTVPDNRKVAQEFADIPLKDLREILKSGVHEDRACALSILVYKFKSSDHKKGIVDFYIDNHLAGNNWDLVDGVADKILGAWLIDKDKGLLYEYAKSENLWERRIAIISTFYFIKNNKFEDTKKIAKILINDKHDLIHKASGWMLREMGKRNLKELENFLKDNYKIMPRTMLRYAIEKFPEETRKKYLRGKI